ncbi:CPBP family intramembrane glutamic endopeptidase [Limnofasciculus baicalensis]|uniref:CPBP family intramembrane metalloprotease n=1 Tax=Limnofasciculus baicalensis BBK-W-15 TaxID=2699891 RepID=A0AAE3KLR9_9CYAN|nr:CPBP family intramembrane glutamic endopeptidase [Limnofasciculus baicalensis]MCP2726943.1 CPBP family intramembrane metalloprotease [Limnofasciculus baicalensis BBK-W-15]
MLEYSARKNVGLAVGSIVAAASIGAAMTVYISPGILGRISFSLCQIWMIGLPLMWFFWIDGGKINLPLPKRKELLVGTLLGLLMFGIIIAIYWFFGQDWIDPIDVRNRAKQVGISSQTIYLVGSIYFTVVNSLLEEYIWRCFVYSKCEILIPGKGAIFVAGLFFTLHHIIGLAAYTNDWRVVMVASLGVFIAGSLWSLCYLHYRSIWSNYISHALADFAIAIVGWQLLFG